MEYRKKGYAVRFWKSLLPLLLCAALLLSLGVTARAEGTGAFAQELIVEGKGPEKIRAFYADYAGNLYLSLNDCSAVLNGTTAQFRLEYSYNANDGERFLLTTGQPARSAASAAFSASREPVSLLLQRNPLYVNGTETRYYTYRPNEQDLYMSLTDLQLILNMTAVWEGEVLHIFPEQPFAPDPQALEAEGFFDCCNALLLADADNGAILFSHAAGRAFPIASLSKLMTYLLLAEKLAAGEIGYEDAVPVSAKAEALSRSADGAVRLTAGKRIPLRELLQAMLLASSNEAALALAEYCAGSEEAFVERMNERADELGLTTARFYSPHGLPVYSGSATPAKLQNCMSAADMFTLSSYLLAHFPEITEITSQQYGSMPSIPFTTANSNPLVFNLPGVTGLKTGSTNRAGYCVVVSLPVTCGEETHNLVLVLLGAETPTARGQAAELLLRWAQRQIDADGFFLPTPLAFGRKS